MSKNTQSGSNTVYRVIQVPDHIPGSDSEHCIGQYQTEEEAIARLIEHMIHMDLLPMDYTIRTVKEKYSRGKT